jgi:hypothetical protein
MLGQLSPIGAEVVAAASVTVSATCRRSSSSLALTTSLSPPVGRRGARTLSQRRTC